ncbi:MAG: hypothetical protein R3A52_14105 [Polyangiales bacterium]
MRLTVQQSGQPNGTTAFEFPPDTVVDSVSGLGGVYGSCALVGSRYEIELNRDGAGADDFKSVRFSIPQRGAVGASPRSPSPSGRASTPAAGPAPRPPLPTTTTSR